MTPSADLAANLMPVVREAAREAGALATAFFRRGKATSARIWNKTGGSPVTEADIEVDTFLKVRLSQILPEAAWLSEETADDPSRLGQRLVWIVDPIDGTRAFLSGHPDWSVALALLTEGRPVLGIVHAPIHDTLYEATQGGGAYRNGTAIRVSEAREIRAARVAGPKTLLDQFDHSAGVTTTRVDRVPSLALRIARVADGAIDIGLVGSDARDWDLAAADLILVEAGGAITALDGAAPAYNRPEPVHGELFAASQGLHPRVLEIMLGQGRRPAQRL